MTGPARGAYTSARPGAAHSSETSVGDGRGGSRLERAVDAAARAWVESFADELSAEGRPITGGWPGTLSEARHHVARAAATRDLTRSVTKAELDQLARRAYLVARNAWLARAEHRHDGAEEEENPRGR